MSQVTHHFVTADVHVTALAVGPVPGDKECIMMNLFQNIQVVILYYAKSLVLLVGFQAKFELSRCISRNSQNTGFSSCNSNISPSVHQ